MPVKHVFTSPKSDDPDGTLVQASDWNADHDITGMASSADLTTHAGAADPHPGYVLDADLALYVPKSLVTTKGDILVATGSSVLVRKAAGANDTILMADSAQSDGLKWVGPATPVVQAFGDAAAPGTSDDFARGSHVHGMPADPVTAHVAAGDPHPTYETSAEAAAKVTTHEGAGDPHTGYVQEAAALISGPLTYTNDLHPASLSANTNDYNPANLATALILAIDASVPVDLTGIAGGADGRILIVVNEDVRPITLKNQSVSSTAGNRFDFNTDVVLRYNDSITLWYDPTSGGVGAWRRMQSGIVGLTFKADFSKGGVLAVGTGTFRWYNDTGRQLTFLKARASVGTAPTGAALIVDINKGGTTLFSTQTNRPQIVVSTNTATTVTFNTTTINDGEYLTVDIDQIGSTVAGSDLTVTIWMFG